MIQLLSPARFDDYELIDTGNYKKLERFGQYILSRPEPQAVWSPSLDDQEWQRQAHAVFTRQKGVGADTDRGEWSTRPGMKEQWYIRYTYKGHEIKFRLGLTAFKHVGIFPEQACNWDYIIDKMGAVKSEQARVLNLFAYTGGASLAARKVGAEVVHVDSVKQVINWSNENMIASGLQDTRWVVEDAMKFVQREVKRGNRYHGIILDPPAYGRGPTGEKWVLEDQVNEMMALCSKLLVNSSRMLILNLYSMGFSPLVAENLVKSHFPGVNPDVGELYLEDRAGRKLPLSIFARFSD
jgi:23S rRNA (cytosine1962-C5)-methyltransferase